MASLGNELVCIYMYIKYARVYARAGRSLPVSSLSSPLPSLPHEFGRCAVLHTVYARVLYAFRREAAADSKKCMEKKIVCENNIIRASSGARK